MYTDQLVKFAARQTATLVAVSLSIPLAGGTIILLLHTLTEFLCAQLTSTMILSVVVTGTALAIRLIRKSNA